MSLNVGCEEIARETMKNEAHNMKAKIQIVSVNLGQY